MSSLGQFFTGTPGQFQQKSSLGQEQQPILNNLVNSVQNPNAGGAYGDSADYYRNLLSNNPNQLQAQAAPDIRNFQQQILPGIANQYSNIGAGGALSGSGFRNASLQAGTDLMERIASLRAGLRQQGAVGLSGLGQQSLGNYYNNVYQPRTPGLLESIAPAIGTALGAAGGSAGGLSVLLPFLQNLFKNNNLQDQVSNGIAAGPQSYGSTYNPYTGVQQ